MNGPYRWVTIEVGGYAFLRPVFRALAVRTLRLFTEASDPATFPDRNSQGGLVTAVTEFQGRTVAIAWSDFRVDGGCYGQANSRRFAAFLRQLRHEGDGGPPLLYVVSSAGVNLMQGRTVFSDAFQLWPELLAYSREQLVVTCATGKCLGLAALLYGLGHYRLAVAGRTHVNLTGPEVLALFFGEGVDFQREASAEAVLEHTDLIHELVPSIEGAFARWKSLLNPAAHTRPAVPDEDAATDALLTLFLDGTPLELLPGPCPSLRVFLGTRGGRPLGIFINPPRRTNNLITVRALEKYAAGLDLFRALRLPIVSFLDSPGVDPRFEQSNAGNIRRMLWVGEKLIQYPYRSMGVVNGRCFGGASSLTIPKVFGGWRALAMRGSVIGAMQGTIIDQLLRQSPRLHEQWLQTSATQDPGLEDLLASGMLDAVIDPHELPGEIDRLLSGAGAPDPRQESPPNGAPALPRDDTGSAATRFLARRFAR